MPGRVSLGGPVIWFFLLLVVVAFFGSLFILIDVARREVVTDTQPLRALWLPIPVLAAFGIIGGVLATQIDLGPLRSAGYGIFLIGIVVAACIELPAYLLRVVFPKTTAVDTGRPADESGPPQTSEPEQDTAP